MTEKDLLESRRVLLQVLQKRISLHGARMWQLPLTYLGAIAIGLNAATNNKVDLPLDIAFLLMALLGVILTWCLKGAEEGYIRTAKNMNEIEKALSLPEFTKSKSPHRHPYYMLMFFGIGCCLASYWFYC